METKNNGEKWSFNTKQFEIKKFKEKIEKKWAHKNAYGGKKKSYTIFF